MPVARLNHRIDLAAHACMPRLAFQIPFEIRADGKEGGGRLGLHR